MIKITTTNLLYKNNTCINGYNTIYKIDLISNFNHVIAMIKSIAKNNIDNCTYTKLDSIDIIFTNLNQKELAKKVYDYFNKNDLYGIKINVRLKIVFFTIPLD